MSEAAIGEAIQAEHVFMQSDVERWQYEQREKALRDYLSDMRGERAAGRAEGRAEGAEQAILQSLRHLMSDLSLSAERAMEVLHIPEDEQGRYLVLLQK